MKYIGNKTRLLGFIDEVVLKEKLPKKGTFIDILAVHKGEKEIKEKAITHFKVLDSNNSYSLIKLNPETGKKHQLRSKIILLNDR